MPGLTLIFLDSFDHYDTSHMNDKWTIVTGAQVSATAGRHGQGALLLANSGMAKTTSPQQEFSVGFAMKINYGSGLGGQVYQLHALDVAGGLVELFSLQMMPDATFAMFAGTAGGLIDNPTKFVATMDTWMYVEVYVELGAGDPMAVGGALSVNGNVISAGGSAASNINTSGLLSKKGLGNYHVFAGACVVGSTYMDDLYIATGGSVVANSQGGAESGFYGDVAIGCIYPRADSSRDFIPSSGSQGFSMLKEHPPTTPISPDDDATFIFDDTVGDVYTAYYDMVSTLIGQIPAVQFNIYARKDDEGSRAIAWFVNGTVAPDITTYFWLGDNYYLHTFPMNQNVWTASLLNASVFGLQMMV